MTWAFIALLGYFFNAVAALFDKYLLSDRIPTPAVYAFFVSLFSLFALFFIPFGFESTDFYSIVLFLLSGIFFVYSLVAFYTAIKHNDISRVAPLFGTVVSLVSFLTLLLPVVSGEDPLGVSYFLALLLLVGGGLLISFDLPLKKGEHFSKMVLVAGVIMALSLIFLKYGFAQTNFVTGIVWSRIGMFLGGVSLLCIAHYRKDILFQLTHFSQAPKRAGSTGVLFVLNKVTAGIGAFLVAYAISIGSLTFVQALTGAQYFFILFLVLPLAWRFPKIYGEKLFFWDWVQKILAIFLIALGLWLAAVSGIEFL